jgi:hypothetical protein
MNPAAAPSDRPSADCLDGGHLFLEPALHLLKEDIAVIETNVHHVDGIAVEGAEARRQREKRDFGRHAFGIQPNQLRF